MRSAKLFLALLLVMIVDSDGLCAQTVEEERGWSAQTEGRHYMVAFPEVWPEQSEKPTPRPMVLYISSRYDTKVNIKTPAQINTNPKINRVFEVKKDQVLTVPIDPLYLNRSSQTRSGFGIEIVGDHPISVYSDQAWIGNGEMTRHLPVEAWGTSYYTMNFYQDRFGTLSYGYKYRPSQILVVAAFDNTTVSIVPTFGTEGGADLQGIKARSSGVVQLNKGETFLIKAEIKEEENKSFSSDLSGTVIASNQPIAVISGHTKVGILGLPDILPPTGIASLDASFVRNNVHDAMLPMEFAATRFVTIPCMYTSLRDVGESDMGIDDLRGDVLRFLATQDNTTISAMRQDGSGLKTVKKINRGESWIETSVETATFWSSDKPLLVGQYGKSYARIAPPNSVRKGSDPETQGGPNIVSGMPMLMTVPPIERWINTGTFMAPEGMDNFINIVFVDGEENRILIDGVTLGTIYGSSKRQISGTPYAYIRTNISAGQHVVESDTATVRWMAWAYGSIDGLAAGRAYGTPIGIDLNTQCTDTIDIAETVDCGDVSATVTLRSGSNDCSSIYAVYAESLTNYTFTNDDLFSLRVNDPQRDAVATVMIRSSSGNFVRKTYAFTAEKIRSTPASIDFGKQPVNTQRCSTVVFANDQTDIPLVVEGLRTKDAPSSFTFTPSSFTIPPGGSVEVEVCAALPAAASVTDTLLATLSCVDVATTALIIQAEEPVIYASDISWSGIPWESSGVVKIGELINNSDVELVVHNYDSTLLNGNFVALEGFSVPFVIAGRSRHEYRVMYQPNRVPGAPHKVEFAWFSSARSFDSISIWNGDYTTSVRDVQEMDRITLYPSPLRLSEVSGLQISGLTSRVDAHIYDEVGRCVASTTLDVGLSVLPVRMFPGIGVYSIVIQPNGSMPIGLRVLVWE